MTTLQFFALVYEYHQGGGYMCIALKSCLALFQFIFVVVFSTFLAQCVDYDILFANTNKTADGVLIVGKRHLNVRSLEVNQLYYKCSCRMRWSQTVQAV